MMEVHSSEYERLFWKNKRTRGSICEMRKTHLFQDCHGIPVHTPITQQSPSLFEIEKEAHQIRSFFCLIGTVEKLAQPRKKAHRETLEQEKLYTLDEVKRIVAQVVAEREATLQEEFSQVLQQKLEGKSRLARLSQMARAT